MTGLLIRGGMVIDGTGGPRFRADVRVVDGLIAEIGSDLEAIDETIIDASGAVVAPGFIENHAHVDPSVFWDPYCDPSPQHGVTTMLAGNCSLSLFPLRPEHRGGVAGLFSLIEDVPLSAMEDSVPWNWTTYAEYRDAINAVGLGLNVAFLVGHSMLRWYVMGEAAWERVATPEEIDDMCRVLRQNLREGAYGMSASFADKDAEGRWVPSVLADDAEYGALMDVLVEFGAIFEFLPNLPAGTVEADVERIANLAGPRGLVTTWNTIAQTRRAPDRPKRLLEQATRLQQQGVKIYPQSSPRSFDLRIGWDRSVMFNDMPETWAKVIRADEHGKRSMLNDTEWRTLARSEWDAAKLSIFPVWDISRLRLIEVTRPELDFWVGRTLSDLVDERRAHPSDVLADWVLENDLNPGIVAVGVSNDDIQEVGEILQHPATIIGASDNGAHVAMFSAAGDPTLYLTRYVRDRSELTLEKAIHDLTGHQADIFGFADRGVIETDRRADLVVFVLEELHWDGDVVVADLPAGGKRLRRPEGGYRCTIVNGEVVQENGILTGARPGRTVPLSSVVD